MNVLDFIKKIIPPKIKVLFWPVYKPFLIWLQKKCIKKLYSNFIKSGDLVFDIGANKGEITEVLLELGARVVAVEPNPELAEKLAEKFGNRINVVQKGAGSREGEKVFYANTRDSAISTFSEEWKKQNKYRKKQWDKKIKAEITTIDKLIEKFGVPRFIKIDVEGFEEEVLKGLSRKVEFVSFEFVKSFKNLQDAEECMKIIRKISKNAVFNYSCSEFSGLELQEWKSVGEVLKMLKSKENAEGDIYARM